MQYECLSVMREFVWREKTTIKAIVKRKRRADARRRGKGGGESFVALGARSQRFHLKLLKSS
jgi:hypothetical protein